MGRLKPWHDPTTLNPLFGLPPTLWEPYEMDSVAQESDMGFSSEHTEAKYWDLSGLMRRVNSGLEVGGVFERGEAGSAEEKHDLKEELVAKPPIKVAAVKKGFGTGSSQHSRSSEDSNAPRATPYCGQRLQRQKSAGRNMQSKSFVTNAMQQISGRMPRIREQSKSFGPTVAPNLSNQSSSVFSVKALVQDKVGLHQNMENASNILNLHQNRQTKISATHMKQQKSCRKLRSREQSRSFKSSAATNLSSHSFSVPNVEKLVQDKVHLHQNNEDVRNIVNLHTNYSPTPQHKLYRHVPHQKNGSVCPTHQRNRCRKQLEVEKPPKTVSRGRKEASEQVGKIVTDLLPGEALPFASKGVADEGSIWSSTSENPGYGISWHCSRIPEDRKKKLTGVTGKTLACGLPVHRRRQGGKLSNVCKNEPSPVKLFSERSLSCFDSESEMTPLLTDPECYHGNSDAVTSVDSHILSPQDIVQKLYVNELKEGQHDRKASQLINGKGSYPKPGVGLQCREWINDGETQCTLSHKYRPKFFRDLVGQAMVVQSLSNAVLKGRIAPAYLFQGPRGTGKSSTARIFAAALNCLSSEVPKPCSMCSNCLAFNSENCSDIREVDAAGNNSIESVQELLAHATLPPSIFCHKVYIIDECHMLKMEAWNTFFKSLEEPPAYVVFILITSYPEELPRTALSRCQRFVFHKIKESEILIRMQRLSLLEDISIEADALQLIASRSEGSLRDSEIILDQLSLLGRSVTLQMVQEMVGFIPDEKLIDLLELSLSGDTVSTVRSIKMLTESGVEPGLLMSQLAALIIDVLRGGKSAFSRDTKSTGLLSEHISNKNDLERLKRALKILSKAEKNLKTSRDRFSWLTETLLQFAPSDSYTFTSYINSSVTESLSASTGTCDKGVEIVSLTAKQCWEEEKGSRNLQVIPIAVSVDENQHGPVEDAKRPSDCPQSYLSNCRSIRDNRVNPYEQLSISVYSPDLGSAVNVKGGKSNNQSQTLSLPHYCSNASNMCI